MPFISVFLPERDNMLKNIFYIIFLYLILPVTLHGQSPLVDSLLSVADTTRSDELKSEIFNQLAFERLPEDYSQGLAYAYLGLEFALNTRNAELIANSYVRIANTYSFLKIYDIALNYYRTALSYLDSIPESQTRGRIYTFVGQTYYEMNLPDSALLHYQMARNLSRSNDAWNAILDFFTGEAYTKTKEVDSALFYLNRAGAYYDSLKNTNMTMECYMTMAEMFHESGDLNKALNNLLTAEKYALDNLSSRYSCQVEQKLAKLYHQKGLTTTSQHHLQLADSALSLNPDPELEAQQHLLYADWYLAKHDYKNSYHSREKYFSLQDSLEKDKTKTIQEVLEIRYQTESKTGEINLLQKDYEIGMIRRKRSELLKLIGTITTIIFLLIVMLMIISVLLKRRTTKKLDLQTSSMQALNRELQMKEQARKQEKQVRDKLFSVISHNLIEPFHILLGYTSRMSTLGEEYPRKEIKRNAGLIHDSAKRLHFLLENLLQWSRLQMHRIKYHPTYFDINNLISRVLDTLQILLVKKKISVNINLPEESIVFADESLIEVVMRNLIHNSIKYSNPGAKISISGQKIGQDMRITVEDQGSGIDPEDQKNLFVLDKHFSRKGTEAEEGTGLGLIIVREILRMHNREISLVSKKGEGTTVTFSLPLVRENFSNHGRAETNL